MIIKIKTTKIHFCFIRLNLEPYSRGSFRCLGFFLFVFFKIFLRRSFCLAILQPSITWCYGSQQTFWNLPPSARRIPGAQPELPFVFCLCLLERPVFPDCSASSGKSPGSSKSFRMTKTTVLFFCILPQICVWIRSCLWALELLSWPHAWVELILLVVTPHTDRCVCPDHV